MRYHNDVNDIETNVSHDDKKHDVSGIVHDPTIQVRYYSKIRISSNVCFAG